MATQVAVAVAALFLKIQLLCAQHSIELYNLQIKFPRNIYSIIFYIKSYSTKVVFFSINYIIL